MLGDRRLGRIATAVAKGHHYRALWNMWRLYPRFGDNLRRYVTGAGSYPYRIAVRTPLGVVTPTIFSHHDMLTVNEIFCRHDYWAGGDVRGVVDLGSNIGISALYFLTRNPTVTCHLFEPNPNNITKLRHNLAGFEARFTLHQCAVATEGGTVTFGVEATGRYGGIGVKTGEYIQVECRGINDVLDAVFEQTRVIDILKIDTEGAELPTLRAIQRDHLMRIRRIYLDAAIPPGVHADLFFQRQYGDVCQLANRKLGGWG